MQRKIAEYVDSVANFKGHEEFADIPEISKSAISGRKLLLVIPNAGTETQAAAIDDMIAYASSEGVTLTVEIYP